MSLAEALPLWPADAELSEEHHRRGPLNHRRQIERCFHELAPDLRRLAYARLGSWHEAEDVVQETFCRALSRPALDTGRPLWPWLATVAHNLCNDILSDRRRLEPSGIDEHPLHSPVIDASAAIDPTASVERAFDADVVRSGLGVLSPTQRGVIGMADVSELSYAEIARTMGRSVPWVASTLMRARQRLRHHVERVTQGVAVVFLWPLVMFRRLRLRVQRNARLALDAVSGLDASVVRLGAGILAIAATAMVVGEIGGPASPAPTRAEPIVAATMDVVDDAQPGVADSRHDPTLDDMSRQGDEGQALPSSAIGDDVTDDSGDGNLWPGAVGTDVGGLPISVEPGQVPPGAKGAWLELTVGTGLDTPVSPGGETAAYVYGYQLGPVEAIPGIPPQRVPPGD